MRMCRDFVGPMGDPADGAAMLREYVRTFSYAVIREQPYQARLAARVAGAFALQIAVEAAAMPGRDSEIACAAADRATHCYPPERLSTAYEGRVHLRNRHQQFVDAVAVGNRDKALRAAFEIAVWAIRFVAELPSEQPEDITTAEVIR